MIDSIVAQVSQMMTLWSGYQFGGCRTDRPLDPCGECRTGCCAQGDAIVIHNATKVLEVRVFGEVLSTSEYVYSTARGVIYRAGGQKWPARDVRSKNPPALEVDVQIGKDPDAWALSAASALACELLLSAGGKKCRLPKNASVVSAQGVTISIPEAELRFLLPEVATWVRAHNPMGAITPARVFSPEATAVRVEGKNRGQNRRWSPWR